ncbi:MAG: hypothetical protein AB7I36_17965 [Rhodospirillaceae bacterium]
MPKNSKNLVKRSGASSRKAARRKYKRFVPKESVAIFADTVKLRLFEMFGRNMSKAAQKLKIDRTMLIRIQEGKLIPKADVFLHLCETLKLDPLTAFSNAEQQSQRSPVTQHLKLVRVVAEPLDKEEERLNFDAIIGRENWIVGKHSIFGLWGRFERDRSDYSPFVLKSNGELMYDSNLSEEERHWTCNLRQDEIKVGRIFTYAARDGAHEVQYRIRSVTELPVS